MGCMYLRNLPINKNIFYRFQKSTNLSHLFSFYDDANWSRFVVRAPTGRHQKPRPNDRIRRSRTARSVSPLNSQTCTVRGIRGYDLNDESLSGERLETKRIGEPSASNHGPCVYHRHIYDLMSQFRVDAAPVSFNCHRSIMEIWPGFLIDCTHGSYCLCQYQG